MTRQLAGPLVTTRIIEFRRSGDPATADQWLQIGGRVTDAAGVAIAGASVAVTSGTDRTVGTATTGADGAFTVGALHAEAYTIHAGHPGVGTAQDATTVPSPAGGYDLTLT
jgi:hypothetical protein